MLEANAVIENRLQEIKDIQKSIRLKKQFIDQLELNGEKFLSDSSDYFKYSVNVVFSTACSIILLVLVLAAQVYFSTVVPSDRWGVPSQFFVAGFAVVVFSVIFYASKQKRDLMALAKLNKNTAGWFDDVVSLNKNELNELIQQYQSLVNNESYMSVLDDAAQDVAKNFLI